MNSLPQAWDVFTAHPVVLLLMPVAGAFIGWITKVLAIWMVFKPLNFVGIGPIGWQGQLPRRAAKFASHAAEVILHDLLDARELVDRLDSKEIASQCDHLLVSSVDPIARELIGDRWDQLPGSVRYAIIARARARTPQVIDSLFDFAKANMDGLFDLTFIVTELLIDDKKILNKMVKNNIPMILNFMKVFGLIFGGVVGLIQLVVYCFTENTLIIPIFGLVVGFTSDWIALQMVFNPRKPTTYLGVFTWQGLFFKYRDEFIAGYARDIATDILTPKVIMNALMSGALADRLFAMLRGEIDDAIKAELGVAAPVVTAAIGTKRYNEVRDSVVTRAREMMPQAAEQLDGYVTSALDVDNTVVEAFKNLDDDEFEAMIRPVFKDDEWLVVWLGGALGFVVGELQVHMLTWLGGLH
ncbi:hypothetical protein HUN08_00145 [Gordonia sp. X0973]|uniref:DUF445 domain-containing protein n=1 Tax=Gordonia sp. X0973 TaxID=2742602 RepID=UPI000F51F1E6|nr:hypothetical protein [Gordonia sp. X0973]QKT05787.1 hypothetical protein HUN08_00145 [Gordonia sp. X0973]